jgi:integrase/recombinase XerD
MTVNVDDVHAYDSLFIKVMQRLDKAEFSDKNKQLLKKFIAQLQRDCLAKSIRTNYLNQLTGMIKNLQKIDFTKNLDELDKDTFDKLLTYLDDIAGLSQNEIRNYNKVTKNFFKWLCDDEPPRWVTKLKLETIESPVQPSNLLTQEEVDKLLGACRHPRNKAFIAVMLDSGMKVGALASTRIKNVEFNQYGAIIYISKTSRSKKTTAPKGIPITWSTGYLNQWLSVHPMQNDPEAPL